MAPSLQPTSADVVDLTSIERPTIERSRRSGLRRAPTLASVSTFPPTTCGIATYTSALLGAIAGQRRSSGRLKVVSLVDQPGTTDPGSVHEHVRGDAVSLERTTAVLNEHDVVSIQHEFGIFGGEDGEEVTTLADELLVPSLVTFHTVLREPSRRQRAIMAHLAHRADRSIVMSLAAARLLTTHYSVPADRIEVIPHGFDPRLSGPSLATGRRPLALTWGLIGPGKGLEVAIEAFGLLKDLDPLPRYRITGATHPGVVASSGESYRRHLEEMVASRGLEDVVEFDDRYLDLATLHQQIRAANLIVLPYLSREQVTSGVLVEAIGAGKPVVSTRFPHAIEVLASGAGVVVPQEDPVALSEGIRSVVADPAAAARMADAARGLARRWTWPAIGARFDRLVHTVAAEPAAGRAPRLGSSQTSHG